MSRWTATGNVLAGITLSGLIMALAACQPSPDTRSQSRDNPTLADPDHDLTVYTVNYPLAYFAMKIGGPSIDVVFPAPPDADPAYWFPDAEIIGRYQKADLILLNGANYALWTQQATLPEARLIDTSRLFSEELLTVENSSTHTHGPDGKHAHRSTAFTTWIDPILALRQAQSVRDALARLRPDHKSEFNAGLNTLKMNLDELNQDFQVVFDRVGDKPLLFSHPVYQYLIQRYGLNARSLHWEPENSLKDSDLADLAAILESHAATVMIWESEPANDARETLKSLGISNIVFSTAANTPTSGDYLDIMRNNLTNLQSAL